MVYRIKYRIKYRIEEISQHNNMDSCWLIVKNRVYDITPFLNTHPIDSNVILKKGGTDVSLDYRFHSKKTRKLWKKYFIGYVDYNNL